MTQIDVEKLSLSSISHRCAQESDQFFARKAYDPRFCYELFRRAILNQNQLAWGRIYKQYEGLVASWVAKHEHFPASGEEVHFFVNEAYTKMWSSIPPEKFLKFDDLKSILRYLQMCVHSVIIDFVRQKELKVEIDPEEEAQGQPDASRSTLEDHVIDKLAAKRLYEWVLSQAQDEREVCIVQGMFVLDLKPRELLDYCPGVFADVREVYRVKENFLARLRRNDDSDQFWGDA